MNIIGLRTLITLFSVFKLSNHLKTRLNGIFSTLKYLKNKLSIFVNNYNFKNSLRDFSYL